MEWNSLFRLGFILLYYQTFWRFNIFVSGIEENNFQSTSSKTELGANLNPESYVYYQGVQGRPGIDFPIYRRIPKTTFNCREVESGYYADLETNCQVFHICNDGLKVSFLCPNGTIFRQTDLICDWWFKVNCPNSPDFYQESAEQLRIDSARKKTSRKVLNRGDITFTSKEVADQERFNLNAVQNKNNNKITQQSNTRRTQFTNNKIVTQSNTRTTPFANNKEETQSNTRTTQFANNNIVPVSNTRTTQFANINIVPVSNTRTTQFANNKEETQSNTRTTQFADRKFDVQSNRQDKIRHNGFDNNRKNYAYSDNDESQITQESSYYNSPKQRLQNNAYPNHKNTYSEIQNPKNYYTNIPTKNFTTSYSPQTFASTNQYAINNGQPFVVSTQKYIPTTRSPVRNTFTSAPFTSASYAFTTEKKKTNTYPEFTTITPFFDITNTISESTKYSTQQKEYTSKLNSNTTPLKNNYYTFTTPAPYITVTPTEKKITYNYRDFTTISPNVDFTNSITRRGKFVTLKPNDKTTKSKYNVGLSSGQGTVALKVTPQSSTVRTSNRNQATFTDNKIVRKGYSVDVSNDYKKDNIRIVTTTPRPDRQSKSVDFTGGNYLTQFYKNSATFKDVKPTFAPSSTTRPFVTTTPFPQYVYTTTYKKPAEITRPKPFRLTTEPTPVETTFSSSGRTEKEFTSIRDLPPYQISSASPFMNFGETTTIRYPVEVTTPGSTGYFDTTIPSTTYTDAEKENNLYEMIDTLRKLVSNRTDILTDSISNEEIPPSVGPQTLHSLAVYFANALENNNVDQEPLIINDTLTKEENHNITSLLTQKTLQNYKELFKEQNEDIITTMKAITKIMENDQDDDDLDVQHTRNLVQSPRVRELAKVFSQALSSYLDDPDMFRRVLQEIRPTEPPLKPTIPKETAAIEEDELLNFSDADITLENARYPIPPSTTQFTPTWGYILAAEPNSEYPDISNNFDDNNNKIGSEVENLQGADSLSLISQLNNLSNYNRGKNTLNNQQAPNSASDEYLPNHWTSSPDATKLWQNTLYVNPLSVNFKLQTADSTESNSAENNPNSSEDVHIDSSFDETSGDASITQDSIELKYELRALPNINLNASQVHGILIDFMNATNSKESNKLQTILHKFNTTENEFLNKMKEIENNPITRRLILLLINECGGTSMEREVKTTAVNDIIKLAESENRNERREKKENNFKLINEELKIEDQDTRALQLLNSLYTIASKYGK